MGTPWRAVRATTVAGRMLPSKWRCNSALRRERMRSGKDESVMPAKSAGKLRLAGIFPGGEPEGADVSRSVRKLANENGGGLIVKAVVVFVGVRIQAAARIAVGEKNGFEATVRTKAGFEGVIGGIGNEHSVIGTHGKKGAVAVNERGAEAIVDAELTGKMAVVVVGRVEGIVSGGNVVGENRCVEARFVPFSGAHGVGEFFAVNPDLPGKQTVRFEFHAAIF